MSLEKQTIVYLYHGILLSNKKERTINTCNHIHESQCILINKSYSKGYKLNESSYMTFRKRQNYRMDIKSAIYNGRERKERVTNNGLIRVFLELMKLHLDWGMETQLYAFVKTHKTVHHKESILLHLNLKITLIPSRSTPFVTNGKVSFFFMAE